MGSRKRGTTYVANIERPAPAAPPAPHPAERARARKATAAARPTRADLLRDLEHALDDGDAERVSALRARLMTTPHDPPGGE